MDEKGIIKFECFHEFTKLDKTKEFSELIHFRNIAFQKGYIGVYPNGIGYGNISVKLGRGFLVSGSATGMISKAGDGHFSIVEKWDTINNQLWCKGLVKASSESLTHAAIYENLPEVKAVLHLHSSELWEKHYSLLPSTSAQIVYGTPQMANAVMGLLLEQEYKNKGVFLMQGHQDGMFAFATSLEKTLQLIDEL